MKKILTLLLLLFALKSTASHLMGGEIQMRHLEQFKYQIRVILYLDLNGENVHAEDSISASIFRNADNTLVEKFDLWHISTNRISSRYPICAVSKFAAMEVIYEQVVELDPADYSDPAGYYIAWQRCCRNYLLANIYSKDPGNNPNSPDASGVTFYLQFPPVSIDGNPFVNSSPEFSTALSNIACVSRDYYEIIHATDEDGDSLVYSIVAPLATQFTEPIPEPAPKPYPAVKWKTLYNELNPLGGASSLTISQDGVLRTTAGTIAGLHVYAIKCEEYRNHVKIGETIRQFEILVYDCPVFYRPELSFEGSESDHITLTLEDTIPDSTECFTVSVFDQDATSHPEEIILAIAPNKPGITTEQIFPNGSNQFYLVNNINSHIKVCLNDTVSDGKKEFDFQILANADICTNSAPDTLSIHVINNEAGRNKQSQTIDFTIIDDLVINDTTFTLNATSTSGLPVEFSSPSTDQIELTENQVSVLSPGRVTITATQKGSDDYLPAKPVTKSFCIRPAQPTLYLEESDSLTVLRTKNNIAAHWYFKDELVGLNQTSLTITDSIEYYTAVAFQGDCLSDPSLPLILTSVTDFEENGIDIYPNPVKEFLNVVCGNNTKTKIAEVYTSQGILVNTQTWTSRIHRIDMNDMRKGLYFIKIRTAKSTKVSKFTIE